MIGSLKFMRMANSLRLETGLEWDFGQRRRTRSCVRTVGMRLCSLSGPRSILPIIRINVHVAVSRERNLEVVDRGHFNHN